jgi:AcrR family transcriptional regulator
MTHKERRAATRTELVEAAAKVFALEGYGAASVDQVAEEAGFSKGAVYSNFDSKEALFMALLEDQLAQTMPEVSAATSEGTISERMQSLDRRIQLGGEPDGQMCLLYFEFWTYAMRNPAVRKRLAHHYDEWREQLSDVVRKQAADLDVPLPHDAAPAIASAALALSEGFVLQRLIDKEAFPDGSYGLLMELFLSGLIALAASADTDGLFKRLDQFGKAVKKPNGRKR